MVAGGEVSEFSDRLIGLSRLVWRAQCLDGGWGVGVWGFGWTAWAVLAGSVTACACPLSCALFTSRAVRDLSEPIRESDGVCQRRTSLDKMTWNFW